MRLGIALPLEYSSPSQTVSYAVEAERKGFDSIWVPEHNTGGEAFSVLGAVAAKTEKIILATGVVNVFLRHPALTALAASTLQEISGGRFILGIGLGDPGQLRFSFGLDVEKPLRSMRDATRVCRTVLGGGNGYVGEMFKVAGVRPARAAKTVKVFMAAVGPKMLKIAAQQADGVIFSAFTSAESIKRAVETVMHLRKDKSRAGDYGYAGMLATATRDDYFKLKTLAAVFLSWPKRAENSLPTSLLRKIDVAKIRMLLDSGKSAEASEFIDDEVVEALACVGTASQILEKLKEFADAGLNYPVVYPVGDPSKLINMLR